MEIEFEDRKLKSLYEHPEELEKTFGVQLAGIIRLRIQTLKSISRIDQLWALPGHFIP